MRHLISVQLWNSLSGQLFLFQVIPLQTNFFLTMSHSKIFKVYFHGMTTMYRNLASLILFIMLKQSKSLERKLCYNLRNSHAVKSASVPQKLVIVFSSIYLFRKKHNSILSSFLFNTILNTLFHNTTILTQT